MTSSRDLLGKMAPEKNRNRPTFPMIPKFVFYLHNIKGNVDFKRTGSPVSRLQRYATPTLRELFILCQSSLHFLLLSRSNKRGND